MEIRRCAKGAGIVALSGVTALAFSAAMAATPQTAEAKTTKSFPQIKITTGMSGYQGYVFGPYTAAQYKKVSGYSVKAYVKTAKIKGSKLYLAGSGKHLYKGTLKKGHYFISYSYAPCKQTFSLNKATKYYKVTRVDNGKYNTSSSNKSKIQKLLNDANKRGTSITTSTKETSEGAQITVKAEGYCFSFSVSGKAVKKLYVCKETASRTQIVSK